MQRTHVLTDEQKVELVQKHISGKYTGRELANYFNVSPSAISRLLIRRGYNTSKSDSNRRYSLNENYFDTVDSEDKAYFLGFLYADGYNHEKRNNIVLCLQEEDKNILEKLNTFINSSRPLAFIQPKNKNWKNMYKLSISSKNMSNKLSNLGCFQKKSLTLTFPTQQQVPEYLIKHFIRGYFDGDGSISISKKRQLQISIMSTNIFCQQIIRILKKECDINFHTYQCKLSKDKNTSTRTISSGGNKQCLRFLDWIYNNSKVYLERKHNIYLEFKEFYSNKYSRNDLNVRPSH